MRAGLAVLAAVLGAGLTACSLDSPITSAVADAGVQDRVSVCHSPRSAPGIVAVASSAVAAHIAHGDYITSLLVSHDAAAANDGVHFRRITDALGAARATRLAFNEKQVAACRITINVSAGRFLGTATGAPTGDIERFPLVVDVPAITLLGSTVLQLDSFDRPTGIAAGGVETVLAPVEPLTVIAGSSTPIILANGEVGGAAAHELTVQGFVFQSGNAGSATFGGQALLALRVAIISFRRNRVEGGFTEKVDLRASSGEVTQNHISGPSGACDVCLAGPGAYHAISNRILAGGVPGITTSGVIGLPVPAGIEPLALPLSADVWSEVRNNEVRDHLSVPVGVGIRVEAIGTMAPNVHNTVHSIIRDNLIVNNRFGILIHAGFPVAGTFRVSNAEVELQGNTIQQSCQAKLFIALARHQRALGLSPAQQYLQNSTFTISLGGNVALSEVWYGHDSGFANELIVDGRPIPTGTRHFYSATGCPGM